MAPSSVALTFSADASERADPRSSSTSPFVMWPDVFASPFTCLLILNARQNSHKMVHDDLREASSE